MTAPNLDTISGLLSKVKGDVRFVDLQGKKTSLRARTATACPASEQVYEPTEAEQRAAAHAAR